MIIAEIYEFIILLFLRIYDESKSRSLCVTFNIDNIFEAFLNSALNIQQTVEKINILYVFRHQLNQ